jgi:hypothetical protein
MRPLLLSLLLCTAALPVEAQVYRWVDDRGVINYGNKPPERAGRITRLNGEESRLSIVPGAVRAAAPSLPPDPAAPTSAAPSAIDRATAEAAGRALAERERCFAERRVDCASPTAATYDYGPAYSPDPYRVPPVSRWSQP